MDASACNYNENATQSGYCVIAESGYDCNGDCINDTDQDGICDADAILGCTDQDAINYDPLSNVLDDTCVFPVSGCTYLSACNFMYEATWDDGSCDWSCVGCTDEDALNYNPEATSSDNSCFFASDAEGLCLADLNFDGLVGSSDLLLLLSGYGQICE
jgi:hypothetical protein